MVNRRLIALSASEGQVMERAEFEDGLRRDGFDEIVAAEMPANEIRAEHAHDFEVRAMVLGGDITLTYGGAEHTYRTGDAFGMAAGMPHEERVGAAGVRYLVGRKRR
jgi:quercetin dioxygenase-like cupin family protein